MEKYFLILPLQSHAILNTILTNFSLEHDANRKLATQPYNAFYATQLTENNSILITFESSYDHRQFSFLYETNVPEGLIIDGVSIDISPAVVPIPTTLSLLATALLGLIRISYRKS